MFQDWQLKEQSTRPTERSPAGNYVKVSNRLEAMIICVKKQPVRASVEKIHQTDQVLKEPLKGKEKKAHAHKGKDSLQNKIKCKIWLLQINIIFINVDK